MQVACLKANEGCTVALTGTCLLNEKDPKKCNYYRADGTLDVKAEIAAPLQQPPAKPKFPRCQTLSMDEAAQVMGAGYCHLIAMLGSPNAGKTAALVSLYLMLAHDRLAGYEFRDSHTLRSFEEISRGSRRWNDGAPPEQMTAHTELDAHRAAGFLHLRVERTATSDIYDLFLPDLPGEWSDSLIDSNRHERWSFLRAADAIWLMIDGPELLASETRQHSLHRMSLLIQRVAAVLQGDHRPSIYLVVTRLDKGQLGLDRFTKLLEEAKRYTIDLKVIQIASFSEDDHVEPGQGIADLLTATCEQRVSATAAFWPDDPRRSEARAYLRFRAPGAPA